MKKLPPISKQKQQEKKQISVTQNNNQTKQIPPTHRKDQKPIQQQQQKPSQQQQQKPIQQQQQKPSQQQQQKPSQQQQQKPIQQQQKQTPQQYSRNTILKVKVQQNNYPIAVLIGVPGVGKTLIMHKLFPNEKQIKEFQLYKLEDLQYNFVDTTGFDFDGDIDQREDQIKKYQELFLKFDKISSLFLVVNFERTDLMKKKLISVYKYFRKFTNQMSIIVTNFHLSESNQDKEHLKKNFHLFQPNDILFVRGDVSSKELQEQLKKSKMLNPIMQSNQFNLKDTIFEPVDLKEYNNLRKNILSMINK